jgi:glycosyltransferase involved in cell wall biosynthesis
MAEAGLCVRQFHDLQEALSALGNTSPRALFDGRVAPDSGFFKTLERDVTSLGVARDFSGAEDPSPCAFFGKTSADFLSLLNGRQAPRFVVGDWLVESQTAPRRRSISAESVRVHALSWEGVGYANGARELMLGLNAAGARVEYRMDWRNGPPDQIYPDDRNALMEMLGTKLERGSKSIVYHPPTHVGGAPILEVYRDAFVSGPLIGYTMFETDALPPRWRAPLAACERVWVPSEFNRHTFSSAGVPAEKIDVVPIGLDVARYDIDGSRLQIPDARGFIFVAIGQWRLRKGWDILLAAYARAFSPDDPVTLVIRAGLENIDVAQDLAILRQRLGLGNLPPIVLLPNPLSPNDLHALYRTADAFVLPTRGEAFGIPYLEAMALGTPTIGTGFGGSLDFLDSSTGYLIGSRMTEVADAYARPIPFYRLQRWAEPSVESTAQAMRAAFDHPDDALLRAARGAVRVRTRFNRETVARRALEALARVPHRPRFRSGPARFGIDSSLFGIDTEAREARTFLTAASQASFAVSATGLSANESPPWLRVQELREIKAAFARSTAETIVTFQPGGGAGAERKVLRIAPRSATAPGLLVEACAGYGEIWAPSTFAADALERGGVDASKLRIVPSGVDTDFWTPDAAHARTADDNVFRFLAVLDWTLRDGWDVVLHAYVSAFHAGDPVSLTFSVTDVLARSDGRQVQPVEEIRAYLTGRFPERANRGDIPPISLNRGALRANDFVKLFNGHDAFVSGARLRAWGFTESVAMACGLPTVAPRVGSHTAFMREENGYLIDVTGIVAAPAESATFAGASWIEPSAEVLAMTLKRLVSRRAEARLRGWRARADIVALHSLASLGRSLSDELDRLSIAAPEPATPLTDAPLLTIVVDPDGGPCDDCVERLERNTTESASIIVLGRGAPGTAQEALNQVRTPYAAVVHGRSFVGPGWDRALLNAIATQPGVDIAMAHCVPLPGGAVPPAIDYDGAAIDRCDLDARETAVNNWSTGSYTGHLDRRCILAATGVLRRAWQAQALGSHAWTAADCRVFTNA